MVHHIVLWNFKESLSQDEKKVAGEKMKGLLEGLYGVIPGLLSAKAIIYPETSSNRDIGLITTLETMEALKGYQVHEAHVNAGTFVRSVTCDRACLDYEE